MNILYLVQMLNTRVIQLIESVLGKGKITNKGNIYAFEPQSQNYNLLINS